MIYSFQYTPGQDRELPLALRLLGVKHEQEPVVRPNGMQIYQLFFCTAGQGELLLDHVRLAIGKGDGFFIYPGVNHSYRAVSGGDGGNENKAGSPWVVDFIGFSGPIAKDLLASCRIYTTGVFRFRNEKVVREHFERLVAIREGRAAGKQLLYSKECYSFLLDIAPGVQFRSSGEEAEHNETVRIMLRFMEEHYDKPVTLDMLSEQVNLSREYMCSVFKNEMEVTIMDYLNRLRIIHARIFLGRYPDKRVKDIAEMCGFSSSSYFCSVFKKITGMSPEMYRNQSRTV